MTDKERYIKLFNNKVIKQYPQAKNLLNWIEQTDFFEAPASSMYHLNVKGGLCKHSLNVYDRLVKLVKSEYNNDYDTLETSEGGIALIGLCHDLCKCNTYVLDYKNVKKRDPYGNLKDDIGRFDWVSEPYYKKEEQLIYGHGSKSVMIIQTFIQNLPLSEILAVRFHQGGMEIPGQLEPGITQTYNSFPLALLTHLADMLSCYIDERIPEEDV